MHIRLSALVLTLALAGCATGSTGMLAADAPRALPADGPVSVSWHDPATFSEITSSGNRFVASEGRWLQDLAEYLRTKASLQLPAGNTLALTIVDIKRAGQYEPWLGIERQNVRMIRDIYPTRMTLRFRELDANGNLIAEGERKLTDHAFLMNASPLSNSDPLRYEKRMIDDWLRRDIHFAGR